MIANLRILGDFFEPQILLGESSDTFRNSVNILENVKHAPLRNTCQIYLKKIIITISLPPRDVDTKEK